MNWELKAMDECTNIQNNSKNCIQLSGCIFSSEKESMNYHLPFVIAVLLAKIIDRFCFFLFLHLQTLTFYCIIKIWLKINDEFKCSGVIFSKNPISTFSISYFMAVTCQHSILLIHFVRFIDGFGFAFVFFSISIAT